MFIEPHLDRGAATRSGRSGGKVDGGAVMEKDVMVMILSPLAFSPQTPETLPGFWSTVATRGSGLAPITAAHTRQ